MAGRPWVAGGAGCSRGFVLLVGRCGGLWGAGVCGAPRRCAAGLLGAAGRAPVRAAAGWRLRAGWFRACQRERPAQGQRQHPVALQIHPFFPSAGLAALTSGRRKSFPAAAPGAGHQLTRAAALARCWEGAARALAARAVRAFTFRCPLSQAFSRVVLAFDPGHLNGHAVLRGEAVVVPPVPYSWVFTGPRFVCCHKHCNRRCGA